MIQLFPLTINQFFNKSNFNFLSPLSHNHFMRFETFLMNNIEDHKYHTHGNLKCTSPNLSYIQSYERSYIIFDGKNVVDSIISVPVFYCESCNHFHALLPYSLIIPHCQYSLSFILTALFYKKYHNLTVEKLCNLFLISTSTLYRWCDKYSVFLNIFIHTYNSYQMSSWIKLLYCYESSIYDYFMFCGLTPFQFNRILSQRSLC